MKVYKFVFVVGILNLLIPFLGIPTSFKQIAFISLGVVSLVYALIVRAIIKEQEIGLTAKTETVTRTVTVEEVKTIEEVVEMSEPIREKIVVSDVKPKRRGRKPKVLLQEEMYE